MKRENTRLRRWSIFLALVLLLTAAVPLTVLAAAPSGGEASGLGEGSAAGEGQAPSGGEADTAPDTEDAPQEEPKEKTLAELRDDLLTILGNGEETAEMRQKIDRMIALGDPQGTLRTYLEGMIRLRQIKYEEELLKGTIAMLEASDPVIGEISQAAAELEGEEPDPLLLRIEEEVSAPAARLMGEAGFDGTGELADMASRALERLDGSADRSDVAAILLLAELRDSGLLTDMGLATAEDNIRQRFSGIRNRNPGVGAQLLQQLESRSAEIARRANNAEALSPQRIVAAGGNVAFRAPVFTYNGAVMLSLEDAARFLDGKVIEMEGGATVVLQAPGVTLEMVKGSSNAYLNDKLQKMDAALLSFDKVCYLPLNTATKCRGMECMTIDGYQLLYTP